MTRSWSPRRDHDANVAPWLAVAEEHDLVVREVGLQPDDATLDMDELERVIGPRTRLVAVGLVSNGTGTINPVPRISNLAHRVGAQLFVDAVAAVPHLSIDVAALGADYLVCSPYKFYGPHLGVLWGRRELLEALPPFHVRPAGDAIPGRFETGTKPFELLAGLGRHRSLPREGRHHPGRRAGAARPGRPLPPAAAAGGADRPSAATRRSWAGCCSSASSAVQGIRIYGITDPARGSGALPDRGLHHRRATSRRRSRASSASAASTCATATTTPGSCTAPWGWARVAGPCVSAWGTTTRAEEIERLGEALDELATS